MMRTPTSASKDISVAVKNILEATADKPFSPTKSQLSRVAAQTNTSTHEYQETIGVLERQLQCADSKWRCYFKTLVVIEYLLPFGNEKCVEWATENLDSIRVLEMFDHDDEKARFRVRYAATHIVTLLSDEKRLQSERGARKSWMSRIPDIHAFDALSVPLSTFSLASNCEPGATKKLERGAPKRQRFLQEPPSEEHPPLLPHISDRLALPVSVKETSIDLGEKSSGVKLHSQKSSRDLLPNARVSPPVLLGSSSQSTALIHDVNLFPQVSLDLPVVKGTSYPLATDTGSSDKGLGYYFRPTKCPTQFTDVQCRDIARLLRESGKDSWSVAPRIYIVLRKIGQLQVLDAFLDQGINDLWLPLIASCLPDALSVAYHQEFIATQLLVLTKALCLENNTRGHAHLTRDDPFPFETKETLGRGGFGLVDKILSPSSGREYARKRFRRKRGMRKAVIESFMNELQILKRLHHIHCVDLISSYTDPKYFGIIMAPVADHDLSTFYQFVTPENTPLLRSFFGCLAGALDFLHKAKIRHRDIKPQNILVKGPDIYFTDFGISLDWEDLSRSTTTKDTAKSMLYCAPEVARWEKRNTSADVWSLGCVFVEMLTLVKRRTVEEQREFFKQRKDNFRFYENISSTQEWIGQLRQIDSSQTSDSFLADCILQLLKENPNERLRTAELYNKISNYQDLEKGPGNPLCGECCVSDTLSVSDSGSDRDPFVDTTEP